jgi:hypothetical protein
MADSPWRIGLWEFSTAKAFGGEAEVSGEFFAHPGSHSVAATMSATVRALRSAFLRTTVLCGKVSIITPPCAVFLSEKHTGFDERRRNRCDNQPLFNPAPILHTSEIAQSLTRSDRRTKPESKQKQVHLTFSLRLAEPGRDEAPPE